MSTTVLPRKYLVLAICSLSLFISSMDVTIVNVALPSIRADFGVSVSELQWTIDAYTLTLAGFLLLSGSLADRFGRKRVFLIGLSVFGVGSLLCSIAPGIGFLIAARAIQGLGGSMLNPVAMSIITNTFTVPKERARAIGIWGAVVGISVAVGPVLGGLLTETIGWRSVFWVNLPIVAIALVCTSIFVPESRAGVIRRLDPIGQSLVIVALVSLVFGLIEGPRLGWDSPISIGLFVLSAVAIAALLRQERRTDDPFIDLRFFRSFPFTTATLTAVLALSSFGGFLFLMTLYLQGVRGLSPLHAGLLLLPMAVATFLASLTSGRLVGAYGTRPSLLMAGGFIAAAAVVLHFITVDSPVWLLETAFVMFGIGFGSVNAPITNSAVSGMPRARAGVAAGLASTSRQVGTSLGVAIAGTVVGSDISHGAQFTLATHVQWWIVIAAGLAIAALAIVSNTSWARRSTAGISALLEEPATAGIRLPKASKA